MIARGLRPDDVILWPGSEVWWWVKVSRPVDPEDSVDGPWLLDTEQLTGDLQPGDRSFRIEDVDPDADFPLIGWDL